VCKGKRGGPIPGVVATCETKYNVNTTTVHQRSKLHRIPEHRIALGKSFAEIKRGFWQRCSLYNDTLAMPQLTMNGLSISLGCSLGLWPGRECCEDRTPRMGVSRAVAQITQVTTLSRARHLPYCILLPTITTCSTGTCPTVTHMPYCHKPALLAHYSHLQHCHISHITHNNNNGQVANCL
jgi:hypothetical protein